MSISGELIADLEQDPESAGGVPPASPAGPVPDGTGPFALPPTLGLPRRIESLRFGVRQTELLFRGRRELGDTFRFAFTRFGEPTLVLSHPEHVKSLFTADPALAPAMGGDSQLAPIVGPNSMFAANGARHLRQRKLLLPPFHGQAVQRYVDVIATALEQELERWPVGKPFALAPSMQSIALDVIMGAMFGIEGRPARGTPEHGLHRAVRWAVRLSASPLGQVAEQLNGSHKRPVGALRAGLAYLDHQVYRAIASRRKAGVREGADDLLSLLLQAETDDGQPLTDEHLRDELLTLVLVGHETSANSLAWIVDRLLHTPHAYDRLRETVRSGNDPDGYLEAVINEGLRVRPVVPIVARKVTVPWRLGEYYVPAGTAMLSSITLLHHRADLYPDPFAFRPERFLGRKPGTYTWIPFGGGVRRCLGAPLATAELRMVLEAIAGRTDLVAADSRPDQARHRNVTMVPARGVRVVLRSAVRPA